MQLCSPREQMGRKVQTGYIVYIGRLHGQGEPAYAVEGVQDHGPTGTLCARLAGQLELSSPACVHAPMFIHDNTIHAGMPHESLACRGTNQKGNFRIGKGSTDRIQGRDAHHRVTRTQFGPQTRIFFTLSDWISNACTVMVPGTFDLFFRQPVTKPIMLFPIDSGHPKTPTQGKGQREAWESTNSIALLSDLFPS